MKKVLSLLFSLFVAVIAFAQSPIKVADYRNTTLPNNGVFTVTGRTNGRIWGDGVYTDDSDLATVCVHAGILRPGETGVIRVTKKPGRSSYPSVSRNGVKSISYGAWDGSYSVALYNTNNTTTNTANKTSQSTTSQRTTTTNVNAPQGPANLKDYRNSTLPNNGVFTVTGRTNGRIWGDGVYTDDSDLATVCVHAGILRPGETGVVRVTKKPGRSSYPSVPRNGVKSISYGAWDGSYSVALYNTNNATTNTANKTSQSTTSQRNASVNAPQGPTNLKEYRKSVLPNNGVFTVTGRTNGRIWGDGVYTDDSDLATVCVHAGILRPGETGVIRVTKKPGRSSYPSVSRNGVKSISYGSWDGSYSVALYNSK